MTAVSTRKVTSSPKSLPNACSRGQHSVTSSEMPHISSREMRIDENLRVGSGSLLVVTGPPGAGKSTVARILASAATRSALVEGDAFFGFLASGAVEPWLPDSNEQNRVVTEAAASAAGVFARSGYTTLYDGVVGPWFSPRSALRLVSTASITSCSSRRSTCTSSAWPHDRTMASPTRLRRERRTPSSPLGCPCLLIIDLPWPEGPITPSGFGLEDLFVALLDRGWLTVEGGLLRRPAYWPYPDDRPAEDPRIFGLAAWERRREQRAESTKGTPSSRLLRWWEGSE